MPKKMVSVPLLSSGVRSERRRAAHFPRSVFVLAICSLLFSLLATVLAQQEDELEALKMRILSELGMKKAPDMSKANTSPEQLKKVKRKYERMVAEIGDEDKDDDEGGRSRREAEPKCNKKSACCRKSMKVNFKKDAGWDWVVKPEEADLYSCMGRCTQKVEYTSNHDLMQAAFISKQISEGRNSSTKGLCCAATKLRPLVIMHYDDKEPPELVNTKHKGMVVKHCSCSY